MGKLKRNTVGGILTLGGAALLVSVLHVESLALLGWFVYCAAVGYGANRAHGESDAASIAKGLQDKR